MRKVSNQFTVAAVVTLAVLFLINGTSAQDPESAKPKSYYIQAQAMGQSTQLGRSFGVTIIVEDYSTAEDQQALFEAFNAKKNEGVVNALSKMKSKGRISVTGTLGYDVSYIRAFPQPDGTTKLDRERGCSPGRPARRAAL